MDFESRVLPQIAEVPTQAETSPVLARLSRRRVQRRAIQVEATRGEIGWQHLLNSHGSRGRNQKDNNSAAAARRRRRRRVCWRPSTLKLMPDSHPLMASELGGLEAPACAKRGVTIHRTAITSKTTALFRGSMHASPSLSRSPEPNPA